MLSIGPTTKIDEFVCPLNISGTVVVRIMKPAHRPRIASTTIKLISKKMLLSILSILFKKIQRIGAGPKATEAQIVAAIPVSVTKPRVQVKRCRNTLRFAMTESG